jgi:hypothetical protein
MYKAMYQISNEYLYAEKKKKVWKTDKSWYFSKSKGHSFSKNEWIKTKLKFDLYLGMAKQYTKISNEYLLEERNKVRKTDNSWYFSKDKGRNNGSKANSNLICILIGKAMYQISNEYL